MKEGIISDGLCVKVYNPVEKKLIAVYNNYSKAANKLGLTHKSVLYHINNKSRVMAPLLNMVVAIRLAQQKEVDINLITITSKRGKL